MVGSRFYLMEFVEGRIFGDVRLEGMGMSEQDKTEVWASAVSSLAVRRFPLRVSPPSPCFLYSSLLLLLLDLFAQSQNLSSIPPSALTVLPASFAASKKPFFERQLGSLLKISDVQAAVPGVGAILKDEKEQAEVLSYLKNGRAEVDGWGGGERRGIVSLSKPLFSVKTREGNGPADIRARVIWNRCMATTSLTT